MLAESKVQRADNSVRLIINADDYGYFACVTRGILDAARNGIVTATGIMANASDFAKRIEWIADVSCLDCGVHLNITYGKPITPRMSECLANWDGQFPGKFSMLAAIFFRRIPIETIENEWRAQIIRCIDSGVQLKFLNSHEHLHMLPMLLRLTARLADEFSIPFVRQTQPERTGSLNLGHLFRSIALASSTALTRNRPDRTAGIRFLGLGISGRLSLDYLARTLPRLKKGGCYELMCHPGYFDPDEIEDVGLRAYHDWEGELSVLRSREFQLMREKHNVQLIGFRDLMT